MPTSTKSPTPTAQTKVTGKVLAGILGAVVVGLAVVAILVTGKDSSDKAETPNVEAVQETATVAVTGAALAPLVDGPDASLGSPAPKIVGQTFSGQTETIAPGAKPMVLAFLAHWCPHCQREVPKMADWARGGIRNGVAIRAIATGTNRDLPNYPPSAWLAREGFDIPTLADDAGGTAAQAYGLTSFPYFVAVDATGKVVARVSGEISEAQFDALIEAAKSSSAPSA
jgi:cytochrome c biogenesis protein CcmG, thiol:disulfide interchange protein DsbE